MAKKEEKTLEFKTKNVLFVLHNLLLGVMTYAIGKTESTSVFFITYWGFALIIGITLIIHWMFRLIEFYE